MTTPLIIFTDGCCEPNPGKGGWAAILLSLDLDIAKIISEGRNLTTNNEMELIACLEALKVIKNPDKTSVLVVSDSAYLVNCFIKKWYVSWEKNGWKNSDKKEIKNKEVWQELIKLVKSFQEINFGWIKGHSGQLFNEECDQEATAARLRNSRREVVKTTLSDEWKIEIKYVLKEFCSKEK